MTRENQESNSQDNFPPPPPPRGNIPVPPPFGGNRSASPPPGVSEPSIHSQIIQSTHLPKNENSNMFLGVKPYYQLEFKKIYESNESYKGIFNMWAFLFGSFWSISKGMWLQGIILFIIDMIIIFGLDLPLLTWVIGGYFGYRGTYMYYKKIVNDQIAFW